MGADAGAPGIPGKATEKFNRTQTFADIDEMFRKEDEQLTMAA